MTMINCPDCGTPNPLGKTFCVNDRCGAELDLFLPSAAPSVVEPVLSAFGSAAPAFGAAPSAFGTQPLAFGSDPFAMPDPVSPPTSAWGAIPPASATVIATPTSAMPESFSAPAAPTSPNAHSSIFSPLPTGFGEFASPPVQAEPLPVMKPPRQVAAATKPAGSPCPNCNHPNDKTEPKCAQCGQILLTACPNPTCPALVRITANFCAKCGTQRPLAPVADPPNSEPVPRPWEPSLKVVVDPRPHGLTPAPEPTQPHPRDSEHSPLRPTYVDPIVWREVPKPTPIATAVLLIVNKQGQELVRFPLKPGENLIGIRVAEDGIFPEVDLEKLDIKEVISRRHARLLWQDQRLVLTDSSSNGTWVNGVRLPKGQPTDITESSRLLFANLDAKVCWI